MINAAIVGIGRWGQGLVSSVQGKSDQIRFTAGVTRTRAKAEDYCTANTIDLRDSYAELLADDSIDAIVLATPHTQHDEQIIAAAKAGKHVFTEKPFTLTKASAERAVQAVRDAGVTVALGHNRRFFKNTEAMKSLVASGELGTLLHIDGNQSSDLGRMPGAWRDSRAESPAGGMTSLGIHALDCMIHIGGRIAEIDTISTRRSINYDIDDATAAVLQFAAGMTGTLVTLASSPRIFHIRVAGSKGWAEMTNSEILRICGPDGGIKEKSYPMDDYPHPSSMAAELNEFAAAAQGRATYRISPEEMVHGTAVLEAMGASADIGGRVKIP
ncbi:Gfo/Idh/MocA family oxidoreductase [Alphaproteobacteria bacterium]|nr:Gfo/Idh/MocA family oxidoreductase [Alphaproteobacteria bacterium]